MFISRRKDRGGVVTIKADVTWEVARDPDSGNWVGVCEPLNATAIGHTWGEFQDAVKETVGLMLTDLHEDNQLEAFLRIHGWEAVPHLPPAKDRPRFELPSNTRITEPRELAGVG